MENGGEGTVVKPEPLESNSSNSSAKTNHDAVKNEVLDDTRKNLSKEKQETLEEVPKGTSKLTKKRKSEEMEQGSTRDQTSMAAENVVLTKGQRIQVQWDVETDEGMRPVWWLATFTGYVTPEKRVGGERVAVIKYDKMENFEACEAECVFVNKRVCYDLAEQDNLFWRQQGDSWFPPVGIPVDQYGCFGAGKEVTMTADELLKDQKKMDNCEHLGVPLEALGMAAMSEMPAPKQLAMANAYRSFSDKLQAELKALVQKNGVGYTVTEKDMKDILYKIQ